MRARGVRVPSRTARAALGSAACYAARKHMHQLIPCFGGLQIEHSVGRGHTLPLVPLPAAAPNAWQGSGWGGAHSRPASVGDQARATAAPASEAEGRPAHRGGRARSLHSSRGPAHRRHWQARRARDRRLCRRGGLRALGGPRGHGAGAGSARVPDAPCVVRGPRRTGRAAGRRATPVCAGGLDSS